MLTSSLEETIKGAFVGRSFQGSQFSKGGPWFDMNDNEITNDEFNPVDKIITDAGVYCDPNSEPCLYLVIDGIYLSFKSNDIINTQPKPLNWDETF